jgi:hypothetical protein
MEGGTDRMALVAAVRAWLRLAAVVPAGQTVVLGPAPSLLLGTAASATTASVAAPAAATALLLLALAPAEALPVLVGACVASMRAAAAPGQDAPHPAVVLAALSVKAAEASSMLATPPEGSGAGPAASSWTLVHLLARLPSTWRVRLALAEAALGSNLPSLSGVAARCGRERKVQSLAETDWRVRLGCG